MAITLSTSSSALLEPKRKSKWLVSFDSLPGNDGNTGATTALSFACYSGAKPTLTMDATELTRMNEKWKFANRPSWNDLEFKFYDFIRADTQNSAFTILKNWWKKIYDPITGQMGYAIEYKTNLTLAMLDPHGTVVQTWNIFYAWPTSVTYGDVSYGSDEFADVSISLKFDYAIPGDEIPAGIAGNYGSYPTGFDTVS